MSVGSGSGYAAAEASRQREEFDLVEEILRPIIVLLGTVAITVSVGLLVERLLRYAARRSPGVHLPSLRRLQLPLQVLLGTGTLHAVYPLAELDLRQDGVIRNFLATAAIIAAVCWSSAPPMWSPTACWVAMPNAPARFRAYVSCAPSSDWCAASSPRCWLSPPPRWPSCCCSRVCGRSARRCWPRRASSASSPVSPPSRR